MPRNDTSLAFHAELGFVEVGQREGDDGQGRVDDGQAAASRYLIVGKTNSPNVPGPVWAPTLGPIR